MMGKHDVVHKTEEHNMSEEEDRTTTIVSTYRKFSETWTWRFDIHERTDIQTYRHAHRSTSHLHNQRRSKDT